MAQADKDEVSRQIVKAAKEWKTAKKRERDARDALAGLVISAVSKGILTENKVAQLTQVPRMTIRKMLGKS